MQTRGLTLNKLQPTSIDLLKAAIFCLTVLYSEANDDKISC